MTMWEAIVLGIVQGITEFLPISSDGHLVIVQHFLGLTEPLLTFDIFIHLGTLAAVLIYFRKLIASHAFGVFDPPRRHESWRVILMVALATVPAVIIGLLLKEHIEETFGSAAIAAACWLIMGLLLIYSTRFAGRTNRLEDVRASDAWWIGTAQVFALLPGISRSGMTIITGMARGMAPVEAARFSFLMAIPAISGAALLQLKDVDQAGIWTDSIMLSGALAAFVVGFAAIALLLKLLNSGNLKPFGIYCICASIVAFLFLSVS
ncbi:MAG: undecaprenyl-diphosphate phosphatase [bacterium]|nr:undecaprenyl-diphosphate phosphatase [bacterium]